MRGVRHSFLAVVLLLVCGMASASARVVTSPARNTSSVAVPNSSANPSYPLEESHLPPNPRNGLFVANNPINATDPLGLWTFGFGGQASVNLAGSLSVGVFLGRDPGSGKWSFGVLGTLAPGIGGPGDVGAGGFVQVTDALCVNSLKGAGIDLGMSGGEGITGGASYVAGINPKTLERTYNGINLELGVGGGAPISGHVRGSGTVGWDTGGGWR